MSKYSKEKIDFIYRLLCNSLEQRIIFELIDGGTYTRAQ